LLTRVHGALVPAVGAVEVTRIIEFRFGTDAVGMYGDRALAFAANQNSFLAFAIAAYADALVEAIHKLGFGFGFRFGTVKNAIVIVTLTIKCSCVMLILVKIREIETVNAT